MDGKDARLLARIEAGERIESAEEMTDEYKPGYLDETLASRVVFNRVGEPHELSAAVIWLASEAGGYVTGQTIVVDGGVTIT